MLLGQKKVILIHCGSGHSGSLFLKCSLCLVQGLVTELRSSVLLGAKVHKDELITHLTFSHLLWDPVALLASGFT